MANFSLVALSMQANLVNFGYRYSQQRPVPDAPPLPKLPLVRGGVGTFR